MEDIGINTAGKYAIHYVSDHYSLLMLTSRLFALELQLKEANLIMLQTPNEYTEMQIEELMSMIYDLRRAVSLLGNGY